MSGGNVSTCAHSDVLHSRELSGLHWNLMKRASEVREQRLRIQAVPEVNSVVPQ